MKRTKIEGGEEADRCTEVKKISHFHEAFSAIMIKELCSHMFCVVTIFLCGLFILKLNH